MDKKQGIFISYRRDTGSMMARMTYDRLRLEKGYKCFLDVEKLFAGNFRERIKQDMSVCDIFILVLSKDALARCDSPNDNVRQEIETAKGMGLTFIPVMSDDFTWPEKMPEGLEYIRDINAIPYMQVYSEPFFERLYTFIETTRAENDTNNNAPQIITEQHVVKTPVDEEQVQGGTEEKSEYKLIVTGILALTAIMAAGIIIPRIPSASPSSAPAEIASRQEKVIEDKPAADTAAEDMDEGLTEDEGPEEIEEAAENEEESPHKWGDYAPSGTAFIETIDGTKYTAIANSLVLKTNEIENAPAEILYKGLDNPAEDENSDDGDLISFSEMESVKRNGEKLDIVDIDGLTTTLEPLENGEILFIGETDTGTPISVYEKNIRSITFDRSSTPPTKIKYLKVKLDSGFYRSPVSFIWFSVNTNEGGFIPSMHLVQDLSTYSGIPLPVKRIQKLTVTKNGNDSDAYVITEDDPHPDETEMTIKFTTGEEVNITTGHYFSIYTMAAYGALVRPSVRELRGMEME